MLNHKELQQKAFGELSEKINIITEASGDLFPGTIYKDETKLPAGRLKANILSVGRHIARQFDVYNPLFIVGYKMNNSSLFFEVWYLPIDGKYVVVDQFGKRTERNEKFETLDSALNELVNVVSTKDFSVDIDDDSFEREVERAAERKLRKKYRTSSSKLDRDDLSDLEFESVQKSTLDVKGLLEQSVISKSIIYDMINNEIVEYNETRMQRSKVASIWGLILGKDIRTPTKYIGGIDRLFTLTGTNKEATFVVGYSLDNKIDIEIWFVKNVITGRGEFYVFDITAGQLIGKSIKTMREAYAKIADKIVLKVD